MEKEDKNIKDTGRQVIKTCNSEPKVINKTGSNEPLDFNYLDD